MFRCPGRKRGLPPFPRTLCPQTLGSRRQMAASGRRASGRSLLALAVPIAAFQHAIVNLKEFNGVSRTTFASV